MEQSIAVRPSTKLQIAEPKEAPILTLNKTVSIITDERIVTTETKPNESSELSAVSQTISYDDSSSKIDEFVEEMEDELKTSQLSLHHIRSIVSSPSENQMEKVWPLPL